MLRLATSLSGDPELARDISQEVFIAVIKGLGRFRAEASIKTWIYRVTIRVAGRQLARNRRSGGGRVDPDTIAGMATAEGSAEMADLLAALNRLPLGARTVLSLVAIEGLSHQAAAEVLGVPVGTVWSRLHGARRKLSSILSG